MTGVGANDTLPSQLAGDRVNMHLGRNVRLALPKSPRRPDRACSARAGQDAPGQRKRSPTAACRSASPLVWTDAPGSDVRCPLRQRPRLDRRRQRQRPTAATCSPAPDFRDRRLVRHRATTPSSVFLPAGTTGSFTVTVDGLFDLRRRRPRQRRLGPTRTSRSSFTMAAAARSPRRRTSAAARPQVSDR